METLNENIIATVAAITARSLGINKKTPSNMDSFMEMLQVHGIIVDVVDDTEWFHVTNAGCINNTILIPDGLYARICKGEHEAVFIFFHELGHLLLGHKPLLHHSDTEPTRHEDSEWQADEFSKCMLRIMKIKYIPEQLCLHF